MITTNTKITAKKNTKRIAILATIIYVITFIGQQILTISLSQKGGLALLDNIPDLQFLNSINNIYTYFERLQEIGRKYYFYILIYDSFYALTYFFMGIFLWRYWSKSVDNAAKFVLTPIFFGGAFFLDIIENISYGISATIFPGINTPIVTLGIFATTGKLTCLVVAFLMLSILCAVFLTQKR